MIRVVLLAMVFGAADQYLGTTHVLVHTGGWATVVSNLSALWLVVPFLAGWSQRTRRRAVVAGVVSLAAAFVGYWALTLSPLEGVTSAQAVGDLAPLVRGHAPWLLGGTVGGPIFGFLGYAWRVRRASSSALAVAAILCGEPFAWAASGLGQRFADAGPVWVAEIAAGACVAVTAMLMRFRRPSERGA